MPEPSWACMCQPQPYSQSWIPLHSKFHWEMPHSFEFKFTVRLKLRISEYLLDMSDLLCGSGVVHALTPPKVSNFAFFKCAGRLLRNLF